MDNKTIELARRAVACEGWRWMQGMGVYHPESKRRFRLVEVADLGNGDICADAVVIERPTGGNGIETIMPYEMWDWLPDLNDPATLGCLLALVREAWVDPEIHVMIAPKFNAAHRTQWVVVSGNGEPLMLGTRFDTEAAALCAVLNGARTAAKEIEELQRDRNTLATACEGYSARIKALVEECDRLRGERDNLGDRLVVAANLIAEYEGDDD